MKKYKFKKGDMVYYYAPRSKDTVPAEVKGVSHYMKCSGKIIMRLLITGDFPTGNRSQWVNPRYCKYQEQEKDDKIKTTTN